MVWTTAGVAECGVLSFDFLATRCFSFQAAARPRMPALLE